MARSSPFTRGFTHLAEDLKQAADNEDVDLLRDCMPNVRRLITMILADPRFQEELPKDMRERLQFVLVS
jgi:hypothetical protein